MSVTRGDEYPGVPRVNLTDAMLAPYPQLRQAMIDVNVRHIVWAGQCKERLAPSFQCAERPRIFLQMTEEELNALINLAPGSYIAYENGPRRFVKQLGSVVIYQGIEYHIYISTTWER